MEKNPVPRALPRSCRTVCAIIRGLHKNLSDLSLMGRGGDVFFFVLRLKRNISETMVPDFGRPM